MSAAAWKRHQARITRLERRRDKIDDQIQRLENKPPCCQHCYKKRPLLMVGERRDGRQILLCSACAP